MPAPYARAGLFWYVFFRHAPPRYAVVRTPDQAQRRDQQYDEQHRVVTDALIARHHAGKARDPQFRGSRPPPNPVPAR